LSTSTPTTLYCSFCGKSQREVAKLIAGPTVFICDECVELCQHIVAGRELEKPAPQISLIERTRDAAAGKALAEIALTYRTNEDLPAELRELADAGLVPFPDYVLLNRRDWDRLVISAFGTRSSFERRR